ncbi:OmpA family protein [Flavobacterium ovatum]|uniref:OmpA family protein n=1 Tax=Flavobacterium ovatum TaxID=1928857 RepID=UPI00344C1ED9
MKTKITFILLLATTVFFGQNQQTGEIAISKTHLISILQKFKTQNPIAVDKPVVVTAVVLANKTIGNDSVMRRVRALENELVVLRAKIDSAAKQTVVHDTVVVTSPKTIVVRDTVYSTVANASNTQKAPLVNDENKNYEQQLNALNTKYDALLRNQEKLLALQKLNMIAVPAGVAVVSNKETKPVEKPITVAAVKPISSLVVVTDSTTIQTADTTIKPAPTPVTAKEVLEAKYAKTQAQVFFDNNSFKMGSTDALRLEQLVKDLKENDSLSVFLEGYTSKSGNADYNNKLSLLRNNAVKQFLLEKGISAKRISSQHHGVDTNSTNEAAARRVDVSFDVKD